MTRLAKYVKPYLLLLAAAVALLFVQAYSNLALPDYLSRIVNVGIQQGGIEDAVPTALRKTRMDELTLFMSPSQAALVSNAFTLVEPGSPAARTLAAAYPALAHEPIEVRKNLDPAQIAALDPVMAKAWLAVDGVEERASAVAGGQGPARAKGAFAAIAAMPAAQRLELVATMEKRFQAMGSSALVQAATGAVRAEYAAIGVNTVRLQTTYMLDVGGLMLLLTLLAAAASIFTGLISARVSSGLARDLRAALFSRVESFSSAEFDRFSSASLITRSTNDIMQIQMVSVMLITMVFYAPIIGIGGIIRAVGTSPSMSWIIALAVGVLMVVVLSLFRLAVPKFKLMQRLMDRLNLVSRETLAGMMVIRAFNRQRHEEKRFDETNMDLTNTMLFVNRIMVIMMPFMMLLMNGVTVLIIWVGSGEVAESKMQVGNMMAFMQYAIQIVFAFLMLSMMFIMLPRAAVSAGRVAEVLETEPSIKDPSEPRSYNGSFEGMVEFRRVSFRYPGAEEDALHDVSFVARPGRTTAFIGATGSGKSTIVNLIPRLYDVTSGSVFVGGLDVRSVAQEELRGKIGFVPQKAVLFSGTIATNLRYADERADEPKLLEAAEISQAREFIATMPEGMEAQISQGGANVSGGQKQRLAIARALVKRAPIYVFDDSFSALDFKTDSTLRRALREKTGGSTVLIVTQRVSTIKNADQIIVLEDGRVVGSGTHRELLDSCETYREIASSQLTKEELA